MTSLTRLCVRALAGLAIVATLASLAPAQPAPTAQPWRQRTVEEVLVGLTAEDPATIEAASAELARRGPGNLLVTLQQFLFIAGVHKDVTEKATTRLERLGAAIARMGPPALPALQTVVSGTGGLEGIVAALALRDMGPTAAPAAPTLVRATAGENSLLRAASSAALVKIGPGAIPALLDGLKSPSADARWNSAVALGAISAHPEACIRQPGILRRDPRP